MSPLRAARKPGVMSSVNSTPLSLTRSNLLPSSLTPASVRWAMACFPLRVVRWCLRFRRAYASAGGEPRQRAACLTCLSVSIACPSAADPGDPRPGRDLRVRDLRGAGGRAQGHGHLRRAGAGRHHGSGRRVPARRADRRHPTRRARRLALPAGAGRGRAAHLRLPPGAGPDGADGQRLRRLRARTVLRRRGAQGARLRARPGAGRADGHGDRHRRWHDPRRAGRPGAGHLPRRALRDPGPGRRDRGRARRPVRPADRRRGLLGAGVCLVWRLLAMWRGWRAPMPAGPASV